MAKKSKHPVVIHRDELDLYLCGVCEEKHVCNFLHNFTGIVVDDENFEWYLDGKWHRELGPAVQTRDTESEEWDCYWLHGIYMEKEVYWKHMYFKYKGTEHEAECLLRILDIKEQ